MHERRVGTFLAHEARRQIEVIVVEEHGGVRLALELREGGRSKTCVDGRIAVTPGSVKRTIDPRRVRQLPQRVLDEPQHRVRDDVVVPVVGLLVVGDQVETVRRPVLGRLVERRTGTGAIFLARRARDPRHVVVPEEAPQRGREPAAATALGPVCLERDGTTVGDDDQFAAHGASVSG